MSHLLRFALLILVVGAVAACGGPAAAPTTAANPTAVPDNPVNTGNQGTVTVEVSGEASFPIEWAHLCRVQNTGAYFLTLSNSSGQSVVFTLPPSAAAGEIPLGQETELDPTKWTMAGVTITAGKTGDAFDANASYFMNPSGTFKLTQFGDTASGEFSVVAKNAAGQEITASGTFADVPVGDC